MASSSTSSVHKSFKYDVFLSFRGEDTRKNFIDHLYSALQQNSIHTYKDDERIEKGKRISDELMQSIEDSRFYIIVFSKNYASSSWCLEELVKIMECQKTSEQTAYPVFYDVEPSEVRKQSGVVGEAFAKHEMKEAAVIWRDALNEAADLAGWELKNTVDGHEAKFIKKIVEEISLALRSVNFSIDDKLIGMKTRIRDLVSDLEIGVDDVRMIGIKGMGGGGKTTLARAVFDQISFQFEGKSFVHNVREVSKSPSSGLKSLQEQVLSNVFIGQEIKVNDVYDGKDQMKKMMFSRKVLVVLDDVDHVDQLEALAGEPNWFKPGSRIIITTRDEQVLVAHRVNLIRDVTLLSDEEALCLFQRHAFGREMPIQGYEELSGQVVHYAAGLPLTIRVLGSFLCGKNELEWKDAIERLETIPLKETLEKLELSYIGLEEDYKEIFLDVACILKGWEKEDAIRVLESCGFHARNGLRVLEQKSLITFYIANYGGECLGMHDHLEEMGMHIVRRLHPDKPYKHSRLWRSNEIEDILSNDLGTKATRCIKWYMSNVNPEIVSKGLGKMKKLRFLHILNFPNNPMCWKPDEVSLYFSNALRYLCWNGYPFRSLPNTFQANNLVVLRMIGSKMVQCWEGGERKVLNKLRFVDLFHSRLKTFDLRHAPNLEKLSLGGCEELVEFHMPLGCSKLKSLDLCHSKFGTLDLGHASNLETLSLACCKELVEFRMPIGCSKLKSLDLGYSKLRTLDLRHASNLETLSLEGCKELVEFHMPVGCSKLKSLKLSYSKLRTVDLRQASNLETLSLGGCNELVEFHMPIECSKLKSIDLNSSNLRSVYFGHAPDLETLRLEDSKESLEFHMLDGCSKLKSLDLNYSKLRALELRLIPNVKFLRLSGSVLMFIDLRLTTNLETLSIRQCYNLVELHMPDECLMLKSLDINNSKLRILNLGGTPNLETLSLKGGCDLVEFHMAGECTKLRSLYLSHLKLSTIDIALTPNVERLYLSECYELQELHAPVLCLKNLVYLGISDCWRRMSFVFEKMFPSVEGGPLDLIEESLDISRLHSDNDFPGLQVPCFYKEHAPLSSLFGNLEKLISVGLGAHSNLKGFSHNNCAFECLTKLTIEVKTVLLSQLPCLEELSLLSTNFKHLLESICKLKHLKSLQIQFCSFLEKLPEDLGRLECLEVLILSDCESLRDVPDSICKMKRLEYLQIRNCRLVEKLPKELGLLECLKELNIQGSNISHLPRGISLSKGLRIIGFIGLNNTHTSESKKRKLENNDEVIQDAKAKSKKTKHKEKDGKKRIKWKKMITAVLKTNPDGRLKIRKVRAQVLKTLRESGSTIDKNQLVDKLEHKINSSSRFAVNGKYVELVVKS